MNRDFVLMDDGNALVSDENGNTEKRYYGNCFQKELLSENKKELIDKKVEDTEKSLSEDKKVKFLSKWMLIIQPFILIGMTACGFLVGGLFNLGNFLPNAIYNAVYAFVASGFCVTISTIYWTIFSVVYKNKIKKKEIKLNTIKKIQQEYEKENNQIKEHEYERRGVYPNHTFNLEADTRRIEDDLDQTIESMYEDDLAVGLTLKKRK